MNAPRNSDAMSAAAIRAMFPRGRPINPVEVYRLSPMERGLLPAEIFRRLYPERFEEGRDAAEATPANGGRPAR